MLPIMLYVQSAPKMQGVQVPYTINNEWMNEWSNKIQQQSIIW